MKIKRRLSIVFHSQTNEQTERQNQNLKHFLRVFCSEKQIDWIKLLSLVEFVYQNSVQFTIECSSFFCMYDYNSEIRYEVENDIIKEKVLAASERVKILLEFREALTERWQKVADSQTKYYNKKHMIKEFNKNDLIMLFIKNIKQRKSSKKLSHKFIDSFRIKKAVRKQTYRLILFFSYRIHNVFHVFYLKSYKSRKKDDDISDFISSKLVNDEKISEIEKILQKKNVKETIYYLIKWKDWSLEYNQWILEEDINEASDLLKEFNKSTKRRKKIN